MLLALGVLLCACRSVGSVPAPVPGRYEFHRLCMGVDGRVVVYAQDERRATEGARRAYARLAELEQVFSDFRPGSEVMRLCDRAGQGPVAVSRDLFEVLRAAGRVHEATGGAFDPTVGALSRLWRESRAEGRLPDGRAIEAARETTGWRHVALDPDQRTVAIGQRGLRMDLGGIAKGYSAMEAVRALRAMGLARAMVSLAGDVAVGDAPPGAPGWLVRVDLGVPDVPEYDMVVQNCSVSTSGDRFQFVEVDGVRYSHILDPRTGVGLTHRVAVSVVAADGALADGAATGLCVAGERGRRGVERLGVQVTIWEQK